MTGNALEKNFQSGIRGLIFAAIGLLFFQMATRAEEVQVFAAASLTDALTEIGRNYQRSSGNKAVFNFAGSSVLARQIQEGAPADVFISADEAKMDVLEEKMLIRPETRRSLLSNSLVIIAAINATRSIRSAEDLIGLKRIALAQTETVPAGIYARRYLEKKELWGKVKGAVVPTENVRAALSVVAGGDADAGMVYKTDAAMSKKVKVVFEVPVEETPGISYPFAVTRNARNPELAKAFLDFLAGKSSLETFARHGFIIRK